MNKLIPVAVFSLWSVPLLAGAQVNSIFSAASIITQIINGVLVPLVFALSFVVFIWGVFEWFIAGSENQEKRTEAGKRMLYGVIGFFIMVSVWGLVNILLGTFNLNQNVPNLPGAPGPR